MFAARVVGQDVGLPVVVPVEYIGADISPSGFAGPLDVLAVTRLNVDDLIAGFQISSRAERGIPVRARVAEKENVSCRIAANAVPIDERWGDERTGIQSGVFLFQGDGIVIYGSSVGGEFPREAVIERSALARCEQIHVLSLFVRVDDGRRPNGRMAQRIERFIHDMTFGFTGSVGLSLQKIESSVGRAGDDPVLSRVADHVDAVRGPEDLFLGGGDELRFGGRAFREFRVIE